MWCHLSTRIKSIRSLRSVVLVLILVALSTTFLFTHVSHAVAGVNQTLSFQGRLTASSGGVVPDGNYNIQFKIYQDGSGTAAGNPGGTLKWTESYINNGGTAGVQVKDGYFSVNLGSVTPFGTSVDWNQDTLWLSMNVAGASASCTTFNTSPCAADGEMLPMKQITSTPYALNAGQVGGKTADNFVQLGQGVQTDASLNTSSIFINKVAAGNLVQLQNAGTDIFTIGATGDLTFGSTADKTISIASADADTSGNSLSVSAGNGGTGTGSTGGDLILQGGSAGGTDGNGGNVQIDAGASAGTGSGGSISIGSVNASDISIGSTTAAVTQTISIGANDTTGSVTNVTVGSGGSAAGGTTAIQSKDDTTVTTNGTQKARFSSTSDTLYVGNANASGQATTANGFTIQGTSSTGSNTQGGSVTLQAGAATSGNANGGTLTLGGGDGVGTGSAGLVVITTPTFQTASQQDCAANCSVTQANVDSNGVVILNATAPNLTVTLNDPTIPTAGRIMYVSAASTSSDFTLSINSGDISNQLTLRKNTTATLLWNGSDWTVASASNSTSLQDVYDNTTKSSGSADVTLGGGSGSSTSGITIRDSSITPADGSLLQVENATGDTLLAVNNKTDGTSNIQVGTGSGNGTPTLFTVDKATSAPVITDDALLGSMYYDTTLGELQCYEAAGWGACSASPDDFVTLSPEYANAVVHSTGTGTMTTDLCSDALNINDGSSSQATICGTNETYNYYNWTSAATTDQTRSIYVTYQLPTSFKGFVTGSTTLTGLTDDADSTVSYQVYRNNSADGLTACGITVPVSTGVQTSWQKAVASGTADPATCDFEAGDSIVFKINLSAKNDANAYASTLGFAFSNK